MGWWKRSKSNTTPLRQIVETEGAESTLCDCCGTQTQKIWGWLHQGDSTLLNYFVRWTEGHPEAGADINLLMGKWGDEAGPVDRSCVSLHLFLQDDQTPAFRVVDARQDFFGEDKLALNGLQRSEVMGTPLADAVFAALDSIWCQDERFPFRQMLER